MHLVYKKSSSKFSYDLFSMVLKKIGYISPYLISLGGVLLDYLTTTIGLGLGLNETNAPYNPILAITIFWGMLALLNLTLPKKGLWAISKHVLVLASFFGAFNNILIITSVVRG